MTILWADNFNIYGPAGVGDARAQQGFWNGMSVAVPSFETTGKRWMRVTATAGFEARRGLGATYTALGGAMRFYFQQYPPANNARIVRHYDGVLARTFDIEATADGNLRIINSAGAEVTRTTTPCFFPGTAHKLQYQMTYNATTGSVEVRIDGVPVIGGTSGVNGSNLVLSGNVTSIAVNDAAGSAANDWYVDFMVPYTLSGTYNNNWPNISGVANLQLTDAPVNTFTGRPLQLFGAGQLEIPTQSGDALDCSAVTNFNLGSGDYTLETWFRPNLPPTGTQQAQIFGKWTTATNNRSYRLVHYGPSLNNGTLRFEISTDGTTGGIVTVWQTSVPWNFIRGRWYHIAVSRTSGQTRVFINGQQIGLTVADANTYFAAGTNSKYAVGGTMSGTTTTVEANTSYAARFDEHRVTVGVGRYTANFSPPVAAFPRNVGGDPSFASVQLLWGLDNSVVDESTTAPKTIALRGTAARATPADASANYLAAQPLDPLDERYIETPFLPATNVLQATANFANGETVTIGAKTYTFNTVLGGANSILIGATTVDSLTNLQDAVNAGPGIGVRYGAGTTQNASAGAALGPTVSDLTLTATTAGAAGNSIVSTETAANAAFLQGATFTGGADIPSPSEYTMSTLPPTTTGIRALFLVDLSYVPSDNATLQKSLVVSGVAAAGAANPLSTTPTYKGDVFEQDPNTGAALTSTSVVNGRIRLARTA